MSQSLNAGYKPPTRRAILSAAAGLAGACLFERTSRADQPGGAGIDPALTRDWLARWQRRILGEAEHNDYCRKESGEEIGWLISPLLNGFYYGYLATGDVKWIERLRDCANAWIKRGIREPDGAIGWPKGDAASTASVADVFADSLLGEAMGLRPLVLMADEIRKHDSLKQKYGAAFQGYLDLAERTFTKWDNRECWRAVGEGGVWVAAEFGIDRKTGKWTDNYARRPTEGFTLPANKQNLVAQWLLAMHDVTGKAVYRERARRWFTTMKSRLRLRDGKFYVWDYWNPAGPWDYKAGHEPRHWIGVHPNGGYYEIDVQAIVAAREHELVFEGIDLDRLIATNRDYMWDGQIKGAKFKSIGGGAPDPRWKDSPGVLWESLAPYDATLRRIFEANHQPDSWGGMASTPWYLALGKVQRSLHRH